MLVDVNSLVSLRDCLGSALYSVNKQKHAQKFCFLFFFPQGGKEKQSNYYL